LTLAAKAVTDRGVSVVTAAGNFGKNAAGHLQWGGMTARAKRRGCSPLARRARWAR